MRIEEIKGTIVCRCSTAVAVLLGLTVLAAPARGQVQPSALDSTTLVRIAELVEVHYWRPITRDSALALIQSGGLGALDPYSAVIPRLDWIYLTSSLENSFGGVGMSFKLAPRLRRFGLKVSLSTRRRTTPASRAEI